MKEFAVRNLRLCTKDCLCLYVCPVGATDTENSIIDVDKCTGCGECLPVCPQNCMAMAANKAEINQTNCLHCGNCMEVCPARAVERRESI